ncbi:MAG: phage integrase N-terminal SAM-like domain-containing protein, partial [Verrucomicrobia bacterium]|nr:phage integrase N-terminal SAM-like domain-containing protein [Verrucomicrobiota bacterium]
MNRAPVSFPEWAECLAADSEVPDETKTRFRAQVIGYLAYLKGLHQRATVGSVLGYLDEVERSGADSGPVREALRWFFRAAARRPAVGGVPREAGPVASAPDVDAAPTAIDPGKMDVGGPPWERRLVERIRVRQLLWRTEQTYRDWIRRFAAFLLPREVESATDDDVKAYLTHMAVAGGAAASTQRQALNALVFLIREVLGREPGDLSGYTPSRRSVRVPTVLSRGECRALFGELPPLARLMAELMYGAGLRVTELLRLRVQDLDFERGIVLVRDGKGSKDRVTTLPESLKSRLRGHMDEMRKLFDEDRAAGMAGVWLPPTVEHKMPAAGTRWEWQWVFPSRQTAVDP